MRTVSARDLRENLAEHLDAVEAGERLVVTRRGSPVAEVVRASPTGLSDQVAAALKSGRARRGGDAAWLMGLLDQPVSDDRADLVDQVLRDRGA